MAAGVISWRTNTTKNHAMKILVCSAVSAILGFNLMAQTNPPAPVSPEKLTSAVYPWEKMKPTVVTNGVRRALFDGPTATVDKLHCHITTLNPGALLTSPGLSVVMWQCSLSTVAVGPSNNARRTPVVTTVGFIFSHG